jgi:hypothetical protein
MEKADANGAMVIDTDQASDNDDEEGDEKE